MTEFIPREKCVCMKCDMSPGIYGQACSTYTCGICNKGKSWPDTGIPKHCKECAVESGLCIRCGLLIKDRIMTQEEIDYQRKRQQKRIDKMLDRHSKRNKKRKK